MRADKFVAYLRVSTARQGRSGLGLDAQRETLRNYLANTGGRLLAESRAASGPTVPSCSAPSGGPKRAAPDS